MPSLADRIKEAFGERKPAEIARAVKKSKGAVTQWLDGTTKSLKGDTATAMEAATGYRAAWIVTGKGPKLAVQKPKQGSIFAEPTSDELELLDEIRSLDDDDLAEMKAEIVKRAERNRARRAKWAAELGVPITSADARHLTAATVARSAVDVARRKRAGSKSDAPELPFDEDSS